MPESELSDACLLILINLFTEQYGPPPKGQNQTFWVLHTKILQKSIFLKSSQNHVSTPIYDAEFEFGVKF